ncbi:MAG: tol-pal system protein YbgF [Acidobacteria bacterium]|nr:tol-pal system protein YbgF [Acidobacteriota bacterium]
MKNALLAAACSALLAGCVSTSDIERLQSQISDLQEQVAQLKRTASSKEEVQNVNTKIAEQTQMLLKSNATLVTKVDQIEERANNTQGSIEQSGYRVDRLAQQVTQLQKDLEDVRAQEAARAAAAAATPVPPPMTVPGPAPITGGAAQPGMPAGGEVTVPAPPQPGEKPMETYQAALRDYQRGNYELAISGLRDFVKSNPKSDLADNAAYWIGESLYSQKKYREAIEQFDRVVNDFPKSDKVPSALLKKGYSYINLNEKSRAIVQLQYVVHEHPRSPEAAKARDELKKLGVESR